jgi:hypothetical protein
MKFLKNFTLISLLLIGGIPTETKPFDIWGVMAIGTSISIFTSLLSTVKIIKAFYTRHDYARNFITNPKEIATYTIHACAFTDRRNKMRSTIIATQTFSGKESPKIIQECGAWASSLDEKFLITIQPAVTLVSRTSYNLKSFTVEASAVHYLQEEITALFFVPKNNRYNTYGKKMAIWTVPLGISVGFLCGVLHVFSKLTFASPGSYPGQIIKGV